MKKVLKVLLVLFLVLIIAVVSIPIIFKGKIIKEVKTQINNNVNAKVDFGDVSLSIFTYFPNLKFSIKGISVKGIDEFEGINLLSVKEISTKIKLTSIFKKRLDILSAVIDEPKVNLIMLKNGKANWDIAKTTSTSKTSANKEMPNTSFSLDLNEFLIKNSYITFKDKTQNLSATINNLNYSLKGNMTLSQVILDMALSIPDLTVKKDGIKYLSKAKITYNSKIDADIKNMKFTIKENKFTLNKIALSLKGFVKKIDDKTIYADVSFFSNKNRFKDLLSMVPTVFTKDYKTITATGDIKINGFVKGKISQKVHPTFSFDLSVNDAGFKYPDLPASASDINVLFNASNPDGVDDHTVLNLKKFTIKLGNNPFSAHYVVKTPVSDPAVEGSVKGKIDFDTLKDVIPIEGIRLKGILTTDVYMKGRLSYIQKQQFKKFIAQGDIKLQNFVFHTKDFPHDINIQNTSVKVSPRYFSLRNFDCKIAKSDFHLRGNISNFLDFYLKNGMLRGNFIFSSALMDLTELVPKTQNTQQTQNQNMQAVEIPKNLDLALNLNLKKIIYDKFVISNVTGKLGLKNSTAFLDKIKMNLIGGNFVLNGSYKSAKNPKIDMKFNLSNLSIRKAFETFNTIKQLAPMAKSCKGNISTNFNLTGKLDSNMQPILSSLNGSGKLYSKNIEFSNSETLNKIAKLLKNNKYKKLSLKNINVSFKLENGDIIISPVTLKINNSKAVFNGKQSVDMNMDYKLVIDIPYKDITSASSVLENLKQKGDKWLKYINPQEKIKVTILIRGNVKSPKVSIDMKSYVEKLKQKIVADLKKKAEKEARKQAAKILAEADKQIAKLNKEARKKAKEIRKAGKKAADKVIKEADKKIDEMVKKANGQLAKTLAQEAGKQLKKEARKKAKGIEREANKRADQLIRETKKQTDKIKAQAKKKTDELIKKAVEGIRL